MSLDTYLDKNFKREIPFIAFGIFSLICVENDNFSSKYKPKCFEKGFRATGTLLNDKGRWVSLSFLTEKTIPTGCFVISGLKFIFHCWVHVWIVNRSFSSKQCVSFKSVPCKTRKNHQQIISYQLRCFLKGLFQYKKLAIITTRNVTFDPKCHFWPKMSFLPQNVTFALKCQFSTQNVTSLTQTRNIRRNNLVITFDPICHFINPNTKYPTK